MESAQAHKPQHHTNTQDLTQTPPPPPPPPPSSVTSPSHEFSFTNSFNSSNYTIKCSAGPAIDEETVDFSPADDIFFHGQLLPLHPILTSDNVCIENFSLATLEHVESDRNLNFNADDIKNNDENYTTKTKERTKGKTSLASVIFGLTKLKIPRQESCAGDRRVENKNGEKKRKGFEVKRMLNKYLSLMDSFFSLKGSSGDRKAKRDLRRHPYSFAGHSNRGDCEGYRGGQKGQFSAPASTTTSPANSGLLTATSRTFSTADDSTMEELKSAIQAAIVHCKNSVASKEQCK